VTNPFVFYLVLLAALPIFTNTGFAAKSVNVKNRQSNDGKIQNLISTLDHEEVELRANAAQMLGGIKDIRAVDPLIKALNDDANFKVRRIAALSLGEIGDARAVNPLIKALHHLFWPVREAAAKALGKLGDKRAIVPLFIALGDREIAVCKAAGNSLKELGEPGGYLLYEGLKIASKDVFEKTKKEFTPRLFNYVRKAFDYWDPGTRESVVWILGTLNDEHAIDFLSAMLSDFHFNVRRAAVWSLGKIGGRQTVDPLLKALNDSSVFVREAAAWNLGDTHHHSVVEPLIKSLDDKSPKVREAALWSLKKIGDQRAVKPAIVALEDPERKIRIAAVWTLGELENPAAVDPLIRVLKDEDEKVRAAAIWCLSQISGEASIDLMLKALGDKSAVVRSAAIHALGKIGNRNVITPLIDALGDQSPEVREAVALVLKKLNEPFGDVISEVLRGNRKAMQNLIVEKDLRLSVILVEALTSKRSEIRQAAAWYLGEVKETRAINNLIQMARGWNLKDRFYGMVALPKLKIDGLDNNLSMALKIFLALPSLLYFLLASVFFTVIIYMIPSGKKNLQLSYSVMIACLVSGLLFFIPSFSLTWTYFAFLTTGILILPFVWIIIKGISLLNPVILERFRLSRLNKKTLSSLLS
jgi:HEAT repeat protein